MNKEYRMAIIDLLCIILAMIACIYVQFSCSETRWSLEDTSSEIEE